jgi:hypothetical protein
LLLDILEKLFINWELDTWANILEIVGFGLSLGAFFIGLFIKSELNKLKTSYIFDKRIKKHIENLKISASHFNELLNDYDNNRSKIRTEFGICISELEDLTSKISYRQSLKSKSLVYFLKRRQNKPFVQHKHDNSSLLFYISKYHKRFYETSYDDTWIVYNKLIEIIRQMENIVQNKNKSL